MPGSERAPPSPDNLLKQQSAGSGIPATAKLGVKLKQKVGKIKK